MNIRKMVEILGGKRVDIAKNAGISLCQLNNSISTGKQVEELKDGRYVTVRKDATYFEQLAEGKKK